MQQDVKKQELLKLKVMLQHEAQKNLETVMPDI
jgi:hypothetical protein